MHTVQPGPIIERHVIAMLNELHTGSPHCARARCGYRLTLIQELSEKIRTALRSEDTQPNIEPVSDAQLEVLRTELEQVRKLPKEADLSRFHGVVPDSYGTDTFAMYDDPED